MALSCYANWVELDQFNSDLSFLAQPPTELLQQKQQLSPDELLEFDYNNYVFSDPDMYPIINMDSEEFFYTENCTSLLQPYFETPYPEIYPAAEYKLICPHEPKRQKANYNPNHDEGFGMPPPGFVPNPCFMSPEILAPFPDFNTSSYAEEVVVKKPNSRGGGSLSAQSIAARVRRRKITEKTQELGKQIPGGQKMNTAEMLQAAFKYIKFLQAQVGILQNLPPVQENEETFGNEELHALLSSSLIQEKLYSAEKCLVPTKYVQILSEDNMIDQQPNTRVLEEVKKLL